MCIDLGTRFRFAVVVVALEVQFWLPVWLLFLFDRGFSIGVASAADAVFRLTVVLAEVPMGMLSDRIGRKKSLHLVLAGTVLTFLLIPVVFNTILLMAAWVTWGLLWALSSGLLTAYAWELGNESGGDRGAWEFVRMRRMVASLALMVSLLSAGWLYELTPEMPFIVTALLALIAFPFAIALPSTTGVVGQSERPRATSPATMGKELRTAVLTAAVILIAGWSIQMIFQPLGLELNLDSVSISILLAAFSGAQFFGAWLVGRFEIGMRFVLTISMAGIAFTCLGVWWGTVSGSQIALVVVSLILLGLSFAVGTTYCDIWVARLSSDKTRATTLSIVSLLGGVVMIVTRPILGVSTGHLGSGAVFGLWGIFCLVLTFGVWLMLRHIHGENGSMRI